MKTTRTSLLPLDTLAGLSDELEKIAYSLSPEQKEKAKKWAKRTAIIAAATGVAGGLVSAAPALAVGVRPHWDTLSPSQKKWIAGGLAGMAYLGHQYATGRVAEESNKEEKK